VHAWAFCCKYIPRACTVARSQVACCPATCSTIWQLVRNWEMACAASGGARGSASRDEGSAVMPYERLWYSVQGRVGVLHLSSGNWGGGGGPLGEAVVDIREGEYLMSCKALMTRLLSRLSTQLLGNAGSVCRWAGLAELSLLCAGVLRPVICQYPPPSTKTHTQPHRYPCLSVL